MSIVLCIIMFTCYDDQYSFAKTSIMNAIENGNNIVLYGSGCNGKTHLIRDVHDALENKGFFISPEPGRDMRASGWNQYLQENHAKKWVVCTNTKEQLFTTFCETAYTLINMDKFRYPQYTALRSGRSCT